MIQKWIKRVVYFLAIIIVLAASLIFFLHTGAAKSMVRNKVQAYLQKKWQKNISANGNLQSADY